MAPANGLEETGNLGFPLSCPLPLENALREFEAFLRVDKSLAGLTTHRHVVKIGNFFKAVCREPNEVDVACLRD